MTNLPLTVLAQNSLKVTVGWTPPAGATGYVFSRDGKRVSSTFDPSRNQVSFGIPDGQPHTFTVSALGDVAEGQVTVNGPSSTMDPFPAPTKAPDGWTLQFIDDFPTDCPVGAFPIFGVSNSSTPKAVFDKWTSYPTSYQPTRVKQDPSVPAYYRSDKTLSIKDGKLLIDLHYDAGLGVYCCAAPIPRLFPEKTAKWDMATSTYGRFEICGRLALAGSTYKVAWLLYHLAGGTEPGAEIDYPEFNLDGTSKPAAFVHYATDASKQTSVTTNVDPKQTHVYAFEWSPGLVSIYLDNVKIGEATNGVPSQPMYWVIQSELVLGGLPLDPAARAQLEIDWVAFSTLDQAPPPPPPPASLAKIGCLQASRYGALSLPDAQTIASRHSYVCTQAQYAATARAVVATDPTVDGAFYVNSQQIGGFSAKPGSDPSTVYAISDAEAQSGWKLNVPWNGGTMMDPANPAVQQKFVENTVAKAKAVGLKVVFLDDCKWKLDSAYPSKYPDAASWLSAKTSFMHAVCAKLRSAGLRVYVNINATGADAFTSFADWMRDIDGYMEEGWGRVNTSHSGSFDSNAWITNHVKRVPLARSLGKSILCEIPADSTDLAMIGYGVGMWALVTDGSGRVMVGVAGTAASDGQHYGTDVWTTVQQNAAKLGKPTAAPAYANGKWTRSFEHGSVTVTPGVSAAVTLS